MSSITNFFEGTTDSELLAMKSQLRAKQRKRDDIAVEVAIIQNLPNIWDMDMANWDDPQISHLKEPYFKIKKECSDLYWEIEEAEAIQEGEVERFKARKTVFTFLDEIGDAKSIQYLQRIGMNSLRLVDAVLANPDFINQTYKEAEA